jgi:hypothetical protein
LQDGWKRFSLILFILSNHHQATGMSKVILVVPEAPAVQAAAAGERRRLSTGGVRLGLLDNSKGNADHLLRLMVEGMRRTDLPIKSVVSLRKGSVSLPAPAGIIDQLAREADVVLSAMAD